ncbi:MAG: hypothetical protein LBO67_03570 [Spirochaetaceae bacterium]|jgi:hypothetical protein|nr:hypothetical protein [Spirochaetaceae bacterium]
MKSMLSKKIAGISLVSLLFLTMSVFAAPDGGEVKSSSTGAPKPPVYEMLDAGTESLLKGDFDAACDQYHAAYLQYPDSTEALFYSVLGDIVAISADPSIISLLRDRFGMVNYRGAGLEDSTNLLKNYRNTTDNTIEQYPQLSVPKWFSATKVYQDSLSPNGEETVDSWLALLLAQFLDQKDFSFNHFIDALLDGALGDSFEAICSRIEKLDFADRVQLDPRIIALFNEATKSAIEPDGLYGRLELETIAIYLRFLKSSLEWFAAYNWDSDLSFLKTDWYDLDATVLDTLTTAQLPFKNDFLTDRHNGMMSKSKADYRKALNDSKRLYDYLVAGADALSFLPEAENDGSDYLSIRTIMALTADALETGGIIWLPPEITGLSSEVGFDLGKFFTPGFFALNQLIAQDGANRRPRFVDQYLDPVIPTEDKRAGFELNISHLKELVPGLWDKSQLVDDLDGKVFLEFTPEVAQKLYRLYY